MNPIRFGTALSAIVIATAVSGCAIVGHGRSNAGSKIANSNIGLATQAMAALQARNYPAAVSFAEQAVAATPNDAVVRLVLGNCYFAAGRFASAETAYKDSLALQADQPHVILKLALVQIAQGKDAQALGYLELARNVLDPADYGLAIALAGRPADAVPVLERAARTPGADARVRQNLALAYGLSGEWTEARTIAAQDLAPGQVDNRIQQWMQMAIPAHPSDQVAALTGVTPTPDPGEPAQLALKNVANPLERLAQQAAQRIASTPPEPVPTPLQTADLSDVQPVADAAPEAPMEMTASGDDQIAAPVAAVAAKSLVQSDASPIAPLPTKFEAPENAPKFVAITAAVRKAAARGRANAKSGAVLQLGAYSSPARIEVAWNKITEQYPALRDYLPMRARYDSGNGTVWRLSISGFDSEKDAIARCHVLRDRGGSCFVRSSAGDSPVEFASR